MSIMTFRLFLILFTTSTILTNNDQTTTMEDKLSHSNESDDGNCTDKTTDSSEKSDNMQKVCPAQECYGYSADNTAIRFSATLADQWAISLEPCLQADCTPVRRYCSKNATWGIIEGQCAFQILSEATRELCRIASENNTSIAFEVALQETFELIQNFKNELTAADVYFISIILDKASDESTKQLDNNFFKIIDALMTFDVNILNNSQSLWNSTDKILYSLDKHLLSTTVMSKSVTLPYLLIRTFNVSEEVIGAMIVNNGTSRDFTAFETILLSNKGSINELQNREFEIAFEVPASFINTSNQYLVTLFYNDSLFTDSQNNKKNNVGSWIISILIPKSHISTDNSFLIRIYYKNFSESQHQECNHWYYGRDTEDTPIKGKWSSDNVALKFKENVYYCEFNHTTHFGMLVSDSFSDNFVLDFITIFGAVLSLLGISIIFITALVFKSWRDNPSNKIILNVALCLMLSIILFFVSDRVKKGTFCIIVGILLHYTILAQFCWMLVISYSSYRRLRFVHNYHIPRAIIKYSLLCWGTPMIIVGITAGTSVDTYDKRLDVDSSEVCYPKDMYLKLGLLLPVGLILTINLIAYVFIIKALALTKPDIKKNTINKSYFIQKFIILFFFMMGITWIFGFLSAFSDNIIFAYFFCTTTACHGFVMFLFYVLIYTNTRELWKNKLQGIMKKKSKTKLIHVLHTALNK